jgi:hypothetical protein
VNCPSCDCPVVILWRVYEGKRRGLERRTLCVRCHGEGWHPLAVPCRVRRCIGAVDKPNGHVCPNCRQIKKSLKDKAYKSRNADKKRQQMREWQQQNREKQRAANKASYEKHKQERLAQRKVRRLLEGDQIREADRKRYAASKEKARFLAKSPATLEEMA